MAVPHLDFFEIDRADAQNRTDHLALTMTPGKQMHNKYGRYHHDDMIGLPFGSKVGDGGALRLRGPRGSHS